MNKVLDMFNSMDDKIKKIMKYGTLFSFILSIISCLVLIIYNLNYPSPLLYKIGIYIFKNSVLLISSFIGIGILFDKIKKELLL